MTGFRVGRPRRVLTALAAVLLAAGCSSTADVAGSGEPATSVPASSTSVLSSSSAQSTSAAPSSTPPSAAQPTSDSVSTPSIQTSGSSVLGLPAAGLAGVNDPSCTSELPPVLLLHGTFSTIAVDFPVLVPALLAAGRCVYGVDYGLYGSRAVRDSAADWAAVVAQVRAYTGADQIDAVGFSQGGLIIRTALRLNGSADQVRAAVLIAPSFHGTTSALIKSLPGQVCPACADQAADSSLMTELAAGGDLDGAVRYAVAVSRNDAVVTPWQSQIPDGPADRVRSVVLEEQCPRTTVLHQDLSRDAGVVQWTVAALANGGDIESTDLVCTPGTG